MGTGCTQYLGWSTLTCGFVGYAYRTKNKYYGIKSHFYINNKLMSSVRYGFLFPN